TPARSTMRSMIAVVLSSVRLTQICVGILVERPKARKPLQVPGEAHGAGADLPRGPVPLPRRDPPGPPLRVVAVVMEPGTPATHDALRHVAARSARGRGHALPLKSGL